MNLFAVILCALVLTASNAIESAEDRTNQTSTNVTDTDTSAEETLIGDVTNLTITSDKNITSGEVEDGKNETVTLDKNESGEDLQNDTSENNHKKRHVFPMPINTFAHPYIGYYGSSQNIETGPTVPVPDPDFVNYYPHNRGYADTIPGTEGRDYPIFSSVPQTQFSCYNLQPGLYGDIEARCQVWHFCQDGARKDSFLCPNGTLFNQQILVCDWWYNVQCETTAQYYGVNSQTQHSGQYVGTRYAQGTAYYPPGFGTNKGTGNQGGSQYRPVQPPYIPASRPTTYYVPAVTQATYPSYVPEAEVVGQAPVTQPPRVSFQSSNEKKGSGYYVPAIPVRPATYPVTVECRQQGKQCGASYTVKENKGDTGYGIQAVQTGYVPTGNVKSGYQYSYSNQATAVPMTGYQYSYSTGQRAGDKSGYQYQTGGVVTPAVQAIRFEPQYPTGGQSGYQYSYSNKASSNANTGYQYSHSSQNSGVKSGYQSQTGSRVTPAIQLHYEVPAQYPSDQSGFQYSYSTQGIAPQTHYQNTFSSQSLGAKSGYQYPSPAPGTGRRVPGAKSGYQYSYSSQVGGPGSSYGQSFSSGYDGQKSGYQQPAPTPAPVPAPTPSPVRVTGNVKSDQYEYSPQVPRVPDYEYGRNQEVNSGYEYTQNQEVNSGYQYGQAAEQNFPRGGGRCANCYGASGRSYAPTTARPAVTTVYSLEDEDSEPQIQY